MSDFYTFTDNAMEAGVAVANTDISDSNLMHLKYDLISSSAIRNQIIEQICRIVTNPLNIRRLCFFDASGAETTVNDYSVYAQNATLRNALTDATIAASGLSPTVDGYVKTLKFNSASVFDFADNDALSFANGGSDLPFSIFTYLKPASVVQEILAKFDATTASPQREYSFEFTTNYLAVGLYDNVTGGYLSCRNNTSLVGDVGNPHSYACTYNGSGANTGLKVYRDYVDVTTNRYASSYTKMYNTTAKTGSYYKNSSGVKTSIGQHDYYFILIVSEELTKLQIRDLHNLILALREGSFAVPIVSKLPKYYKEGLAVSNNATDVNNDLDFNAGSAMAANDAVLLTLSKLMTKRCDATWAVGSNAGGFVAYSSYTSKTASRSYVEMIISNGSITDCCMIDATSFESDTFMLSSAGLTALATATGWTEADILYRPIFADFTDASGNIMQRVLYTLPNGSIEAVYKTMILDLDETPAGTSAANTALSVPRGVTANISVNYLETSDNRALLITNTSQTDTTPSSTNNFTCRSIADYNDTDSSNMLIKTDNSRYVRRRVDYTSGGATSNVKILTLGYIYHSQPLTVY